MHVSSWTTEGYVARNLHHHVKESLQKGEVPPYKWVTSKDSAILQQLVRVQMRYRQNFTRGANAETPKSDFHRDPLPRLSALGSMRWRSWRRAANEAESYLSRHDCKSLGVLPGEWDKGCNSHL